MPIATHTADRSGSISSRNTTRRDMSTQEQSQWLFTEEELQLAPSIVDGGLPPEKERENRGKGVNFILQAGIMLKLPQITLATASVFLHRFYMRHSMVDTRSKAPAYHYYSMAATCLFLATKVEENCRKMRELVVACVRVAQKDPYKMVDENDREFWRWRDNILASEDLLLETLCFDLSLDPPYKILFELLLQYQAENNKKLRNAAWAFVNDSCLTVLCLRFPTKTIAASAFYAAAKYSGAAFPDDQHGRPWWEGIGVEIDEIRQACNIMADNYQNVPAKAGREGFTYEKTPEITDISDVTRMPRTSLTPDEMDVDQKRDDNIKSASHDGQTGEHGRANGNSSEEHVIASPHKRDGESQTMQNGDNPDFDVKMNGAANIQEPPPATTEEHLSEEGELEET